MQFIVSCQQHAPLLHPISHDHFGMKSELFWHEKETKLWGFSFIWPAPSAQSSTMLHISATGITHSFWFNLLVSNLMWAHFSGVRCELNVHQIYFRCTTNIMNLLCVYIDTLCGSCVLMKMDQFQSFASVCQHTPCRHDWTIEWNGFGLVYTNKHLNNTLAIQTVICLQIRRPSTGCVEQKTTETHVSCGLMNQNC